VSLRVLIARKAGSAFVAWYKRMFRIIKEMMAERDAKK
jgi:hypothetical protein